MGSFLLTMGVRYRGEVAVLRGTGVLTFSGVLSWADSETLKSVGRVASASRLDMRKPALGQVQNNKVKSLTRTS